MYSYDRLIETEKYAHVTFFFNGGVERQFDGEERHMIPSPKVPTYDKDPKMSVLGVAERVAEVLKKGEHPFVMCNFAPPDMVCHPLFQLVYVVRSIASARSAILEFTRQL